MLEWAAFFLTPMLTLSLGSKRFFLLAAVAEETHGESMRTNIALLRQNARIAAQVARAIAELK